MSYSLSELNQMTQDEFVAVLGGVFEDTPAIAQKAWEKKPFANVAELHHSMVEVVKTLSKDEQLALIRAHPDLGSKAKMAEASVLEQAEVGLDKLTLEEHNRFMFLNQAYKDKFGFPFIIAVKNHTKTSILDAFEHRLENTFQAEMQQALTEITQIAWFRLQEIVKIIRN